MDELYRMLGQERRADFEREARRRSLAALATRPQPSSSVLPVLRWRLRKTDRTRRSDGKEQIVTHTRIYVKRQKLARRIERAAVPERPHIGRGPRYLVQPSVTTACAPALHAIGAALRDESIEIDNATLEALKRFITDGSGPFFDRNSTAAVREIVRLHDVIVGATQVVFDEEHFAIAV